ncbi:oligogalacturonide lyase [Verrucomicrobium sp. GAS474]|uniref:oligogalacturonate lyase family protein n=1 Tax=Verrucomicrobium sp. GAS474 TaxID=1882831 RepID=UPI00087AAB0F|nr:oligogalacturonate lyase family protein [Verrucomicrobium sp. GAS474]SDU27445.1 oligogalacturonide lyase [Verrucomicrobium sp. GAS474]
MNPLPLFTWLLVGALSPLIAHAADAPLADAFKDSDTGAQIVHLSKSLDPAAGVIYFTQASTTPDSRYTLVRHLDPGSGHTAGLMYRYDFKTGELRKLTDLMTKNQVLAPASGNLYFTGDNDHAIYVTNLLDFKTRKVADIPAEFVCTGGLAVNADETLVVGTGGLAKEHQNDKPLTTPPNQSKAFNDILERHETNLLLAADIKTGKVTELHRIDTWLGHVQFSPTDPKLLMYCHEGNWAKVDRIWLLRIGDGSQPQLVLKRTEENEIAGHEFWSSDGTTVWYDHLYRNTPDKHFLEGKNIATGEITRYPIVPPFGSIHYTNSPDGKFFVCDGGTNKTNPALQAMYILVPEKGALRPIKLCTMAANDYKAAEPNPHLTPDQRWVTFTATFSGKPQAYAVEMPKEFRR